MELLSEVGKQDLEMLRALLILSPKHLQDHGKFQGGVPKFFPILLLRT